MVRIIAGTLLYVGIGRIKESDIPGIIKSRDRKKAVLPPARWGFIWQRFATVTGVYYGTSEKQE